MSDFDSWEEIIGNDVKVEKEDFPTPAELTQLDLKLQDDAKKAFINHLYNKVAEQIDNLNKSGYTTFYIDHPYFVYFENKIRGILEEILDIINSKILINIYCRNIALVSNPKIISWFKDGIEKFRNKTTTYAYDQGCNLKITAGKLYNLSAVNCLKYSKDLKLYVNNKINFVDVIINECKSYNTSNVFDQCISYNLAKFNEIEDKIFFRSHIEQNEIYNIYDKDVYSSDEGRFYLARLFDKKFKLKYPEPKYKKQLKLKEWESQYIRNLKKVSDITSNLELKLDSKIDEIFEKYGTTDQAKEMIKNLIKEKSEDTIKLNKVDDIDIDKNIINSPIKFNNRADLAKLLRSKKQKATLKYKGLFVLLNIIHIDREIDQVKKDFQDQVKFLESLGFFVDIFQNRIVIIWDQDIISFFKNEISKEIQDLNTINFKEIKSNDIEYRLRLFNSNKYIGRVLGCIPISDLGIIKYEDLIFYQTKEQILDKLDLDKYETEDYFYIQSDKVQPTYKVVDQYNFVSRNFEANMSLMTGLDGIFILKVEKYRSFGECFKKWIQKYIPSFERHKYELIDNAETELLISKKEN